MRRSVAAAVSASISDRCRGLLLLASNCAKHARFSAAHSRSQHPAFKQCTVLQAAAEAAVGDKHGAGAKQAAGGVLGLLEERARVSQQLLQLTAQAVQRIHCNNFTAHPPNG